MEGREGERELNLIFLTASSVNASVKVCFRAFLTRYFERKRESLQKMCRDVYYCLTFLNFSF